MLQPTSCWNDKKCHALSHSLTLDRLRSNENLPVTRRPSRRRSDGLWKRACNVHHSSIICFRVWGHELLWSSVISFWKSWSCGQMWTMWTMDCRKSCCLNKPFACCDTGPKLATGRFTASVWGQLQETPNAKHWRICCNNGKMLVASQAQQSVSVHPVLSHTLKCSQSSQSSHSSQSYHPSQSSQSNSRRALGPRILSHLASQLDTTKRSFETLAKNSSKLWGGGLQVADHEAFMRSMRLMRLQEDFFKSFESCLMLMKDIHDRLTVGWSFYLAK